MSGISVFIILVVIAAVIYGVAKGVSGMAAAEKPAQAAYSLSPDMLDDLLDALRGGAVPFDASAVRGVPVPLQGGERLVLVCHGVVLREARSVRQGVYGGPSARVNNNLFVSAGAFRSASHEELHDLDAGDLYLTNTRLIFLGEKRTSTVRLTQIVGVRPSDEAVAIHRSGKQRTEVFARLNQQKIAVVADGRRRIVLLSGHLVAGCIEGLIASGGVVAPAGRPKSPTRRVPTRRALPAPAARPKAKAGAAVAGRAPAGARPGADGARKPAAGAGAARRAPARADSGSAVPTKSPRTIDADPTAAAGPAGRPRQPAAIERPGVSLGSWATAPTASIGQVFGTLTPFAERIIHAGGRGTGGLSPCGRQSGYANLSAPGKSNIAQIHPQPDGIALVLRSRGEGAPETVFEEIPVGWLTGYVGVNQGWLDGTGHMFERKGPAVAYLIPEHVDGLADDSAEWRDIRRLLDHAKTL